MKFFLLALMLLGAQTAKSDALLDAIMGWKTDSWSETRSTPCRDTTRDEYGYDRTEPEHYSWDSLYLDPYENTEIIIDPYKDLRDKSEDY